MDAVIRRATAQDADGIGAFQTRAWQQAYRGLVPESYLDAVTAHQRSVRWRRRILDGERSVWVAHAAGDLIGVASTSSTPRERMDLPELELSSIYVDASVYGQGVAQLLLGAAIADKAAHLWVFDGNTRAQRFYARQGFEASTERQSDSDTGLGETRWIRLQTAS